MGGYGTVVLLVRDPLEVLEMTGPEYSGTRPPGQDIVDGLREQLHLRVNNDFMYHPNSTPEIGVLHEMVRDECAGLAHWLVDHTPAGRERSLALTSLEEVMFWSNAAIARIQGS